MGSESPSRSPVDLIGLVSDPKLVETRGFIGGEWVKAADNKTFPVYEPSSGRILLECSDFGRHEFIDAIDAAHVGYQRFYGSTTARERGALLRKWHDLILSHVDDLAIIMSLENGKVLTEARGEIIYAASFISWFAEEATRNYGDTIPSSFRNTMVFTVKEPIGVCGIITPWNFPAAMITRKIAPAFAAGCSVVIKPPSETPFSALALAKLAIEAGLPRDIIHKISFTGSTAVGKMLTQLAGGTMKKVSMELGGNAPFIVFDDAKLDQAVEGALASKFRSSGQTCVCANRIFVHESVLEVFTAKLVKQVQAIKLGRGIDASSTHGPRVNSAAVMKVAEHVEDAIKKGGTLHVGGKEPEHLDGCYYEPTVVTGVNAEMLVATEETFGPLAAIFSFKTEEEVINLANNTEFGLAGYFFSQDIGRVMRVAGKLQCGMIGVNTGLTSAVETPFGGIKESGIGREGSRYGMSEYQNIKAVTIGNSSA